MIHRLPLHGLPVAGGPNRVPLHRLPGLRPHGGVRGRLGAEVQTADLRRGVAEAWPRCPGGGVSTGEVMHQFVVVYFVDILHIYVSF